MVPGMKTKHGKSQRSLVVYCRFGLMIFKKKEVCLCMGIGSSLVYI